MTYWRGVQRPRCSRRPQRERPVPHQCRMQTRSRNPRFGGMVALMTNIPQVNIWVEAEAFFDSITDADIALRIVAATEAPRGGSSMSGASWPATEADGICHRRACASLVASLAVALRWGCW